jgi:lysozyme family protein
MSVDFLKTLFVILDHERGFVVDNGGPTNWGISTMWLIAAGYPDEDVEHMTPARAGWFYEHVYEDPARPFWPRCREIEDQTVCTKVFDMVVNMGVQPPPKKNGVLVVQRACIALGNDIVPDGLWGPKTLAAVNSHSANILLTALVTAQAKFYRNLAASNPQKFGRYLVGWLRRAAWPGGVISKE